MSFDLFYFVMDMESRGRLFLKGGDDAARPTVVTTSRSPTYAKSSRTPKVNPFLYASPLPTLLNGMLLHTPSHMHDRFTPTSTEAREEARNIKPDKTDDAARPTDAPPSTTPSPPSGPMTRARAKFLQAKVNSLLSSCNFGLPLDGLLLHATTLCILSYGETSLHQAPKEEGPEEDAAGALHAGIF